MEHIQASKESGGRLRSQHSQFGRISSIGTLQRHLQDAVYGRMIGLVQGVVMIMAGRAPAAAEHGAITAGQESA